MQKAHSREVSSAGGGLLRGRATGSGTPANPADRPPAGPTVALWEGAPDPATAPPVCTAFGKAGSRIQSRPPERESLPEAPGSLPEAPGSQLAGASRQPAAIELPRLASCRGGLPPP